MGKRIKDEELLKVFFEENKQEIADNHFSDKVMSRLPEEKNKEWIVLLFSSIGVSLFLALGFYSGLFTRIAEQLEKTPYYFIIAAIFILPIAIYFIACARQNCKVKLI